jgi:hypothetical protein
MNLKELLEKVLGKTVAIESIDIDNGKIYLQKYTSFMLDPGEGGMFLINPSEPIEDKNADGNIFKYIENADGCFDICDDVKIHADGIHMDVEDLDFAIWTLVFYDKEGKTIRLTD